MSGTGDCFVKAVERSEWTIYEGDGEHPAQPLVRRGHGKADIEGWKRIEVVPAEQLRGAVEDNERLLNRLKTLYADLAAPGPIDAERQRTLAELARDVLGGSSPGGVDVPAAHGGREVRAPDRPRPRRAEGRV
jgi:hypothetical protein